MEFKSSFLIISSFLLFLFCLAKIYNQKKIKVKNVILHKLVPPGPWKLPLIGNLHQLALGGSLPHHTLRNLSLKHGPMMHLQLGEISAVVVSSPDIAKEILKTNDLCFSQRPQILSSKILFNESTDVVFAPYGDYWRQMRKICTTELLSAKRVQSFSSIRENEVQKLIQSIHSSISSEASVLDFTKIAFSLASSFITRAVFGKKSEYEDELLRLLKQTVEMTGGFDVADMFPSYKSIHLITRMKAKMEKMKKKLGKILDSIIDEHRLNGVNGENLIHVLLRVQQSGSLEIPITDDNVKVVIWDMFGAGSDTSATVIEWAMSELMKNPKVRKKAQAEIRETLKGKKKVYESDLHEFSYLKSVIKETMRLHPPATLLARECRKACKIDEYEIPTKTKVIVNILALGRDPKYWYDAEKFMPERFQDTDFDINKANNSCEYMPFGTGRRICPGISLGLANIELPLAALLYHFDWKIPNGMKAEDLDMTESFGATVPRRNNLYLIATPYISAFP